MKTITIQSCPGYEEWREQARFCLQEGIPPHYTIWQDHDAQEQPLFSDENESVHTSGGVQTYAVSKAFLELASIAACHSAPERFSMLYRLLWRMCHENKALLNHKTDDDVILLNSYVKAVRRDAYKIKAFLRFREVSCDGLSRFIAWYEPEHYSLDLSLPFFQTRFKNMNWSIITPYRAAHWDKESLVIDEKPDFNDLPKEDDVEKYWLKYYASTFNPARPKKSAMLNQMPKKYWKNMPETVLIPELLKNSESRTRSMIDKSRKG